MSIRQQAAKFGHEIVGELIRLPDLERNSKERIYVDSAGNEYITRFGILTIITAEGGVI